jgi:hypothetical protein
LIHYSYDIVKHLYFRKTGKYPVKKQFSFEQFISSTSPTLVSYLGLMELRCELAYDQLNQQYVSLILPNLSLSKFSLAYLFDVAMKDKPTCDGHNLDAPVARTRHQ